MQQARHWILTIPYHCFTPYLAPQCCYIHGQLERGETGYLHWQIYVVFKEKVRLRRVKSVFGDVHAEPTRSEAGRDYCLKDDTVVDGTRFTLGALPLRRNSKTDWDSVWQSAITNTLMDVPANVRVQHYRTLRTIASDYAAPDPMVRSIDVFWGSTGLGKSRDAWQNAGMDAFSKDPRSKFWDGYRGQKHVVIDEFRGAIDISHVLRWCDRYPVNVEIKGSSTPLKATHIWFTSNLHPRDWYKELDEETTNALLRRLNITHYDAL